MFADCESILVHECVVCKCACPGEEFELAAEVSRLQCEAEVHNGLINDESLVQQAWRLGQEPQDHPGPGSVLPRWGGNGKVMVV